jgi:hypothetical protein
MKQTLRGQLTNILFLVLIVAAALTIYFLSRAEDGGTAATPTQTVAPTATPVATPAEKKKTSSRGVPESVFTTYLATAEAFTADENRHGKRSYTLTYGKSPQVTATLQYEVLEGSVSSVEVDVPLPAEYKKKGSTSIDHYLYENAGKQKQAVSEALLAILSDLLPASDAEDELQLSSVRYWAEQAMLLKKTGDDFEDTLGGYHFLAYRSEEEALQTLICILYLAK